MDEKVANYLNSEEYDEDLMVPGGSDTAMCMFILQKYAGLTFNEAWTYLTEEIFGWDIPEDRSRQSRYGLKKSAIEKINSCEEPVLELIKPYVVRGVSVFF